MSYFPLDRDILTSSVWAEPPETVKVWIYFLLSASPADGIMRDTEPAIAMRCGVSLEAVRRAVETFERPDGNSRTKRKDGRRIERCAEGWRVINYEKHRDKDYSTPRVQKWRLKRRETVKRDETSFKTTDTDTDTETKGGGGAAPNPPPPPPSPSLPSGNDGGANVPRVPPGLPVASLWDLFVSRGGRGGREQFRDEIRSCVLAGRTIVEIRAWIEAHPGADVFDMGRGMIGRVRPATGTGTGTGATAEPPPVRESAPVGKPSCPRCKGIGFLETVVKRDGVEYPAMARCACNSAEGPR